MSKRAAHISRVGIARVRDANEMLWAKRFKRAGKMKSP